MMPHAGKKSEKSSNTWRLKDMSDLLDQQAAAKGKPGYVAKTNDQLEKEAREKPLKITDRFYDHQLIKANDDDQFNAICGNNCSDDGSAYRLFSACRKKIFR